MDIRKNRWTIIAVIVLAIGAIWYVRRNKDSESFTPNSEGIEVENRVNQFLEESGIELPADSQRANLADTTGGQATGVATRQSSDDQTTFTVIAALPDVESGWYEAWLTGDDKTTSMSLGRLRLAKGGYLTEHTLSQPEGMNKVVVTHQESEGQSEDVILEGSFE